MTNPSATAEPQTGEEQHWKDVVRKYQKPSKGRALWQICNTLVPLAGLWVAAYFAREVSCWLIVPLAVLAGGFLMRAFIIFHDCTHGSFLKSRRANDILGFFMGVLVFTPYHKWKWEHTLHHSSAGDLDRRGMGDVWTLTVQEYLESSRWQRFSYRLNRNPIVLFGLGPFILFFILHRIPIREMKAKDRRWVHVTTMIVVLMGVGLSMVYGWQAYVVMQFLSIWVVSAAGVWLFYVQHQFEEVYWDRSEEWEFERVAMEGSSFYRLPKVLQWFTGNIGFHHVHHLSPRIPNYHLERAHSSEPVLQAVEPMTIRASLKSFKYRLWDEENRRLVGYDAIKGLRRTQP